MAEHRLADSFPADAPWQEAQRKPRPAGGGSARRRLRVGMFFTMSKSAALARRPPARLKSDAGRALRLATCPL